MAHRILFVEDHRDTRVLLSKVLRAKGYDVVAAVSASEALAACEHHEFDLLLCDLGLPDQSGHDLMRALHEKCHLKGIAYTGYGMEADVIAARNAGFNAHLLKPVDNKLLFETIDSILGQANP